jgi:hypothetical protein
MLAKANAAADQILADFERLEIPAATRATELRVLRQIRHIAIRDMVDRLH